MPSVTVTVGSSPKPTCAVSVTPSLSGTTLKLTVSWKLNAINGYSYWGYGVRLQYGTNGTSWTTKNLVSESTSQWAQKTGEFTLTYSSVTSDKKIYFRLCSYPDGGMNGSSKSMTIGINKLTVAKGSNISSVSISTGSTYNLDGASCKVTCVKASATGYDITFSKWTSSNTSALANSTSQTYSFKMPSSNITLTASATKTAHKYTVAYYANGGSGSTASSSHVYGTSKALTANGFTRTGYTFKGWATSSGSSTVTYSNKQSVLNLSSVNGATVKLYAVWQAITYTVKYNANGGSGSRSTSYGYTDTVSLSGSGFSRTGYSFQGWSKTTTGSVLTAPVSKLSSTNGATVNLYAIWKANTYKIQYLSNYGTGTTATSTHTYDIAKNLTANGFVRTGYTFKNWYCDSLEKYYTDKQSVKNVTSQSITLQFHAQWNENTYTVKYNANGGTGSRDPVTVRYTQNVSLSGSGFSRTGYTFLGWSKTTTGAVISSPASGLTATNGGTVTLYARWAPKTYTVNYQIDIGGITIQPQTFTYDQYHTLPSPDLSSANYIFVGWEMGSTKYSPGAKVKNLSTGDPVTLTCIAIPDITGFDAYTHDETWEQGTVMVYNGTEWKEGEIKMYLSGGWKV